MAGIWALKPLKALGTRALKAFEGHLGNRALKALEGYVSTPALRALGHLGH